MTVYQHLTPVLIHVRIRSATGINRSRSLCVSRNPNLVGIADGLNRITATLMKCSWLKGYKVLKLRHLSQFGTEYYSREGHMWYKKDKKNWVRFSYINQIEEFRAIFNTVWKWVKSDNNHVHPPYKDYVQYHWKCDKCLTNNTRSIEFNLEDSTPGLWWIDIKIGDWALHNGENRTVTFQENIGQCVRYLNGILVGIFSW